MPVNKDALVRYRIINKCLTSKFRKYPSKSELRESCMDALGMDYISQRTIEKDIEDMRYNEELGFNAPIEYSKKEKGYYYTDPNYSIDKIPLSSNDVNALQFAASVLNQFKQISLLGQFSGAVEKIVEALNINRMMLENQELDFIEFDKAGYVTGGEFLEKLVTGIKDKQVVEFSYKKHGTKELKSYTFHPYLLKEFRNIWYVIGLDQNTGDIKTFGLDRMVELELVNDYFEPVPFDRDKYFRNIFGITSFHDEPEDIVLKFTPKTGDYIKALPLHWSQKVLEDTDSHCRVMITVYPTWELIMQILSYGPEAEVEKPKSFRKEISKILKKTTEKYK